MNWIFGKRLYNKKEEEYVMISSSQPRKLPRGKYINYVIDNDSVNITHNFRIQWMFKETRTRDGQYQSWYYIDNHTITTIHKDIQSQIDNQQESINLHNFEIEDHSQLLDDIIIDLLSREE